MKSIAEVANNNIAFERGRLEELPSMTVYKGDWDGNLSEKRYKGGVFLWFITFVPFLVHISKYDYGELED